MTTKTQRTFRLLGAIVAVLLNPKFDSGWDNCVVGSSVKLGVWPQRILDSRKADGSYADTTSVVEEYLGITYGEAWNLCVQQDKPNSGNYQFTRKYRVKRAFKLMFKYL